MFGAELQAKGTFHEPAEKPDLSQEKNLRGDGVLHLPYPVSSGYLCYCGGDDGADPPSAGR